MLICHHRFYGEPGVIRALRSESPWSPEILPQGRDMGKSTLKPQESNWTTGPVSMKAKDPLPTKRAIAEHSQSCLRCKITAFDFSWTDFFQCEIILPANFQPAASPSKSLTQNTASPKGFFFLLVFYHLLAESALQQFVPLILSLLMPHILYLHGSINALLWAHECRYFVNLLHSRDWDNSILRMEKHINRIFNEMTVSVSYTWTKDSKWPCNALYTCFFS